MNIRDEIVTRRARRLQSEGHDLGCSLPSARRVPVVPFGRSPFIICEVKRKSPSKGDIAPGLDAAGQAGIYSDAGIQTISVLTEEDYFGGSLNDLIAVKEQYPEAAVLRKDFLLDEEDIEISFRAGADAVLLIAAMHSSPDLERLYETARAYGLACLVEVHSKEDVEKIRPFSPGFVGINSRNLETFQVDLLIPMEAARHIDWKTNLVFESGIHSMEEAVTALDAGFSGLLVGESVVKDPALISKLKEAYSLCAHRKFRFWPDIAAGIIRNGVYNSRKPLVKICGITNTEDADAAAAAGADILGFIFADSPRRADVNLPGKLRHVDLLKVAVVTGGAEGLPGKLRDELFRMIRKGTIDAVQFHGDEDRDSCFSNAYPYYKAVRVREKEDLLRAAEYRCPRILLDAYSTDGYGGTGKTIDSSLLAEGCKKPLWLAGGLGPDNIRQTVRQYSPELIDASSRLELYPGKKDHTRLKQFFQEIQNAV